MFEETLALVEEAGLAFLHVFPYSARSGTPAARMPQLPMPLRRERAARLRAAGAAASARHFAGQIGREICLLAESDAKAHAEDFSPVRLTRPAMPGALLAARVIGAGLDALIAEPV